MLLAIRQPMLEAHIALKYFTQARYASAFGRDIVASLPAGSIYFGGTDPGHGLVTAFAHASTNADAIFVITQNALADSSYLDYVGQRHGQHIRVPTPEESQKAFQDYLSDAQRRFEHDQKFPTEPKQVKPDENIQIVGGRVQVAGQRAVMSINALLTRILFDNNPSRVFYVEESFPLEWMYPHLEPHGLIMKLHRQPFAELAPEIVTRDREFWMQRLRPMVGDWLNEDTTVAEVCAFIERTFLRKDLGGFAGDPTYVADPYACKAFSSLRSSIAGVYRWRTTNAKDDAERRRMQDAADFAFRQSLGLCPYNPEAVSRYCRALAEDSRVDDALKVARVAVQFTEIGSSVTSLIRELESRK